MDYHARHGHDVCSFDLPSTRKWIISQSELMQHVTDIDLDRMPTVSAAQALEELDADAYTHVSTSLPDLDRALMGFASSQSDATDKKGGIAKSQITEFWGPPGVGKTALG